jgi:VanZ family protein
MSADDRLRETSRAAAILFLPAWAGVVGGELGPPPTVLGAMSDKTMHFLAYLILSLLATIMLRAGWRALFAMIGLIAMGGALEIIQGFVGRDADILDEFANARGALSGALIGWLVLAAVTGRLLVGRRGPN